MHAFLATGWQQPWIDDDRVQVSRYITLGGPHVREAGQQALDGTPDDVRRFLDSGRQQAQNDDDRIKVTQLLTTGGPEVQKAAQRALDGTVEDVQAFLATGYALAAERDQETATVAHLANLAKDAGARAAEQTKQAQDAASRAIAAAQRAKDAAQRAAAETQAAKDSSVQAAGAAARAADAARGAAEASKTAVSAASEANRASRIAANAAAQAATAASLAEQACSRAYQAASAAAADGAHAVEARQAAVDARNVAAGARAAADAANAAGQAADASGQAAGAARSASANADAAASAASEAAGYARSAGADASRAEQAAATAKAAADRANRAASAAESLAGQAAAAARQARDAANAAAGHADAAANAADQAAQAADEAKKDADAAAAYAAQAKQSADVATTAADQAAQVETTSRQADAQRLQAEQEQAVADAQQAKQDEAARTAAADWKAGEAAQKDAETQRLLDEAANPATDPALAITDIRTAAAHLMATGGPWTRTAAATALSGDEAGLRQFLSSRLAVAIEQDDRTSVITLADTSDNARFKEAALAAFAGTYDQVKEFLRTRDYQGKADDDRIAAQLLLNNGGPAMKEAANTALNGTARDVAEFLRTGQYEAASIAATARANAALGTGLACTNSFLPDTPLLLGDGSRKRIDQVRIGDVVRAGDPLTGRLEERPVTNIIIGEGPKSLVAVSVTSAEGPQRNGTVESTGNHPFWVDGTKQWTEVRDLRRGDVLDDGNGGNAVVSEIVQWQATARVYNLTVDGLHSYFVFAGEIPVLVHNAACIRFVVDTKGVIRDLEGPQAQILLNKAVGDGFRNDVAAFLRERGRTVVTDAEDKAALTFQTPYGPRTFDIGVWDSDGKLLGYVEAKTGGSVYNAAQQAKDEWLRQQYGFNIDVVRYVG
ncbi:hypothetical protein FNH05_08380 [Amycolatopsis rhizosphaerae]|uniref:Uncharacterized protein n=1 Tax=Amycolatopsis rhizosphaerae TaxID=2053003 RepID=A0A558D5Q2_9PSEU|nr:hypothetical protein FNH05_08380 [Amycolatopsis rhizosphaerae]